MKSQLVVCQSVLRGWLARNRNRRKIKLNLFRKNVSQEILATERTYLKTLTQIIQIFLKELPSKVLSSKDHKKIFSPYLVTILKGNTRFLKELESRLSKWTPYVAIADTFYNLTEHLKVYNDYVIGFYDSITTFCSCLEHNALFNAFIKKTYETLRGDGIFIGELPALLITPIQRIPRYRLLLEELNKYTPDDHPDKSNGLKALKSISEVATSMNERQREAENTNKIYHIQQSLVGKLDITLSPSCKFLQEGPILQLLESKSKLKERNIFLFNEAFLLTKPHKDGRHTVIAQLPLHNIYCLDVHSTSSCHPLIEDLKENVIEIQTKGMVYILVANTKKEKSSWSQSLNSTIALHQAQRKKLSHEADRRATLRAEAAKTEILLKYTALKSNLTNSDNDDSSTDSDTQLSPHKTGTYQSLAASERSPRSDESVTVVVDSFASASLQRSSSSVLDSSKPEEQKGLRRWATKTNCRGSALHSSQKDSSDRSSTKDSETVKQMIEKHYSSIHTHGPMPNSSPALSESSSAVAEQPALRKHTALRNRISASASCDNLDQVARKHMGQPDKI
eukprot:TRINITY_DN1707_c0_g2_i2.p1 TRINITY_DN1707_c0_g2~~TRINITY_DN1707_c0_g2_i2.p1  ORF type:complete len:565 (+),score=92.42 TRINITY_DN1707_c0_g2_i2:40-1734(+)